MTICCFILFIVSKHEADGRVIIAEFESFRIMNSYVPTVTGKMNKPRFKGEENGIKNERIRLEIYW